MGRTQWSQRWAAGGVIVCAGLLSLLTVFNQVKALGLSWHETHYKARIDGIMAGEAPAPAQYRLLSNGIAAAACRAAAEAGLPRPVGVAMVTIRLAQNLGLFLLALWYYRKLGLPVHAGLLGLSAVAWGMTQSNFQNDLGIDAYSDMLAYLAAALVLLHGRAGWIIPIALFAAFNRETAGLIPLLPVALAGAVDARPASGGLNALGEGEQQRLLRIGMLSWGLYLAVFLGLRGYYGERPWASGSLYPPIMLVRNLGHPGAWMPLLGIWGIIPVVALLSVRAWPPALRAMGWAVVPLWLAAHLLFGSIETGRMLLLPLMLVFVPGALSGLHAGRATAPGTART